MEGVAEATLLGRQPPEWPEPLEGRIAEAVSRAGERLVVFDDDPTGSQTAHDVQVVTGWEADLLAEALADPRPLFVITNSRSLREDDAVAVTDQAGRNLRRAAELAGVRVRVASRSDSTLRGHFPAEVDALGQALGGAWDGVVLVPCFVEGGRLTADDVHWVRRDGRLVPVGETEYARDAAFGFRSSRLPEWVEEKSAGRLPAGEVIAVGIPDLRWGGPDRVSEILSGAHGRVVAVNALTYRDLEVFVAGLLEAERAGLRLLYRTSASFVRVRAAVPGRPPLRVTELTAACGAGTGGLVVCGSHVPNSTAQLHGLLAAPGNDGLELDVTAVLERGARQPLLDRLARRATAAIAAGRTAVVYTSREVHVPAGLQPLEASRRVSAALVEVVRAIAVRPSFVVAKGGITSSDLATLAFGIRRADVLGQVVPGVSVWRDRGAGRAPVFVVFPGNVGEPDSLRQAVATLGEASAAARGQGA